MNPEALKKLKNVKLLSKESQTSHYVSVGAYALNHDITGDFNKGIPVGKISEYYGNASTAKTVFLTHILKDAQKKGFYTMLVDSENAYSADFATTLGLDPDKLIYCAPETLEDCFETIESTILSIREVDKKTPIVIGYDSLAVSPSRSEYEAAPDKTSPIDGAKRALAIGQLLRKINPKIKKYNVSLVIINQLREKVGVMFGSNETKASGGRSLEFYLGVSSKTLSNKTSDLIRDENKQVIGIQGKVRNTKNKEGLPFRESPFKLYFDKGLDPWEGVVEILEYKELVSKEGGWYIIKENGIKFRKKQFSEHITDLDNKDFAGLRKMFDLKLLDS
jgi:recombination protein RecA